MTVSFAWRLNANECARSTAVGPGCSATRGARPRDRPGAKGRSSTSWRRVVQVEGRRANHRRPRVCLVRGDLQVGSAKEFDLLDLGFGL